MYGILSIHKMSPPNIKKIALEKNLIQLVTFSTPSYMCILTSSDPIVSKRMGFGNLHYVLTFDKSPA